MSDTDTIKVTIADDDTGTASASMLIVVLDSNLLAVGTDAGSVPAGVGGTVNVYNGDGALVYTLHPFGNFAGGIRTAVADVNGDGVPDIIMAAGPGGGPRVEIVSGADGTTVLANFFVYDPNFTNGVFVASGDVNNDGKADIITGADAGGGPHVKVIDGTKINQVQANGAIADSSLLASFFAYDPGFRGGVRVAAADVTGDHKADVIVGAGTGGGPHVQVIDATKLTQTQANGVIQPSAAVFSFMAFSPSYTGGVYVAGADFTGDGKADIVVSEGTCIGSPMTNLVKVFDGASNAFNPTALVSFDPYADLANTPNGEPNGVRVTTSDRNDDKVPDLVLVPATEPPRSCAVLGEDETVLENFTAFDPGFLGGVFVGG